MATNDLFNLANKFRTDGNLQMAFQLWAEVLKTDPLFGAAYLNMADVFRQQNNVIAEKDHLNKFLDCPLTGRTLTIVPQVATRIAEIEKTAPIQIIQIPK